MTPYSYNSAARAWKAEPFSAKNSPPGNGIIITQNASFGKTMTIHLFIKIYPDLLTSIINIDESTREMIYLEQTEGITLNLSR